MSHQLYLFSAAFPVNVKGYCQKFVPNPYTSILDGCHESGMNDAQTRRQSNSQRHLLCHVGFPDSDAQNPLDWKRHHDAGRVCRKRCVIFALPGAFTPIPRTFPMLKPPLTKFLPWNLIK
ncbi:hypothetical protein ACA910_010732 [Epithemia clementina (nom. ined.)]